MTSALPTYLATWYCSSHPGHCSAADSDYIWYHQLKDGSSGITSLYQAVFDAFTISHHLCTSLDLWTHLRQSCPQKVSFLAWTDHGHDNVIIIYTFTAVCFSVWVCEWTHMSLWTAACLRCVNSLLCNTFANNSTVPLHRDTEQTCVFVTV